MKKMGLILMLGCLFIASNLFAAEGDFIVQGDVGIGNNITTPGARLEINTDTATNKGLIIKGAASQSANLLEVQNSSANILAQISSKGAFTNTTTNSVAFSGTSTFDADDYNGGMGAGYNVNITGSGDDLNYRGIINTITYSGTDATGAINRIDGVQSNFRLTSDGSISKTINAMLSQAGSLYVSGVGMNYNITNLTGLQGLTINVASGALNVGTYTGISAPALTAGTITTLRGISVGDQTRGSSNTNLLIGNGTTGNWSIYNNSSYKNYFAGALGIGTDTPGSYKLYVAGNVYATGSVTQNSDVSFKKNINSIDNALNKVMNLKGVTYEWKKEEYKDKGFDEGKHYGVVAQEVEKILPETVKEGPDGHKGVAYTEMIPVLIEAMKEQQRIIENQKKEMEELRVKVQRLEARDFVAKAQNENQ